MSNDIKPRELLDRASVQLIYANQFVEMLSELALDVLEAEAPSASGHRVDKVYALTHALGELLKSTKQDVDNANNPQAWTGNSTPSTTYRRKATQNHQPQEVPA